MHAYQFVPKGSTHTVRLFVDDAAQLELEVGFMTYEEASYFAELSGRSNIISTTGETGETRLVSDSGWHREGDESAIYIVEG